MIVATAPRNAAPKPKPVTTAAANSSGAEVVTRATSVPTTPTVKTSAPTSIARSGGAVRRASEPRMPVPLSARISSPPTRWLSMPNTSATSEGPSEA